MKKININTAVCIALVLLIQFACTKEETRNVPVVTISSISKTMLNIGDTLIIKGGSFDRTPARNLVSVASISFPVLTASGDQLSVLVPANAQSGTLSVGFESGKATTFEQPVTIFGATQPVITSILPATAYEGDTIIITGRNFGIPYDLNSVVFNGTLPGKILNATPAELKVVVPDLADTGPVQVTTSGQTSLPYQYTIAKPDTKEDGQLYWLMLFYDLSDPYSPPGDMTQWYLGKGMSNRGLPQVSIVASKNESLVKKNPVRGNFYSPVTMNHALYNFVVNDEQRNGYYLTSSAYPFPATYQLMKLPADDPSRPVAVWSQDFPAPGVYTTIPDLEQPWLPPTKIPQTPLQQVSIDGNTVYMKIGLTDDYYVGDVSATNPVFTRKNNLMGDSTAYNLQFTRDFIFYSSSRITIYWDSYPKADTLYFRRKSSNVSEKVPFTLPNSVFYASILADPAHGNNVLIITKGYDPVYGGISYTISRFNADTRQTTVLYSSANWSDASYPQLNSYEYGGANSGFMWLGNHIYYACSKGSQSYTALRRLNDDGSSSRPVTIYGRMEPLTTNRGYRFSLFSGK